MQLERLVRWVLFPAVSVVLHWCLLVRPDRLLPALPQLWIAARFLPAPAGAAKPPGTRSIHEDPVPDDVAAFLSELQARRTIYDYMFTSVLAVSLWGGIGMLLKGPFMDCCWPFLSLRFSKLWRRALVPATIQLHRWGFGEAAAYAAGLVLSAEGCRHPSAWAWVSVLTSLVGGLSFMPCWAYSTRMHAGNDWDSWKLLRAAVALGGHFQAAVLAPLAIVHKSQVVGFLAVLAIYGALVATIPCLLRARHVGGFDPDTCVHCCAAASACLALCDTWVRNFSVPADVLPFASGLVVFGHAGYLAAVLVLASMWRSKGDTYMARQVFAMLSLLLTYAWGWLGAVPALKSASFTFALLFLLEKELENQWNNHAVKVLATGFILQYLYSNHEYVLSTFNPERFMR